MSEIRRWRKDEERIERDKGRDRWDGRDGSMIKKRYTPLGTHRGRRRGEGGLDATVRKTKIN